MTKDIRDIIASMDKAVNPPRVTKKTLTESIAEVEKSKKPKPKPKAKNKKCLCSNGKAHHDCPIHGAYPIEESTSIAEAPGDRRVHELNQLLDQAEESLNQSVEFFRQASRYARINKVGGVFSGQIDSYTVGWLEKFIEDEDQPGSIACLREMIGPGRVPPEDGSDSNGEMGPVNKRHQRYRG